ncbi:MAG: DUF2975 domain-containing protein [Actinomycetota bacterium]|nr:DUF2975 domain-containing protein [Actinomycetota bacterium]
MSEPLRRDAGTAALGLRSRSLRFLQLLLTLAALFVALQALAVAAYAIFVAVADNPDPGASFVRTPSIPIWTLGGLDLTLPRLAPGVGVNPTNEVSLGIENPTTQQTALVLLTYVVDAAVYVTFFVLLRQLVRQARHADPFTPATARRLRFLGGFLILGALVAALTTAIAQGFLTRTITTDRVFLFDWDTPGYTLVTGLVLIVIGEIVRCGAAMREDLEGTV